VKKRLNSIWLSLTGTSALLMLLSLFPVATAAQPASCGEPTYRPCCERGLWIWQDCDHDDASVQRWHFRATGGGSTDWLAFKGHLSSVPAIAATGHLLENNDVLDVAAEGVTFEFNVFGGGTDGFDLELPAGTTTCIVSDSFPADAAVEVGADRLALAPPFNLGDLQPCLGESRLVDVSFEVGIAEKTVSYHMSVADYDGNGYPDILLNRRWGKPFSLYRNVGGVFEEDFGTDFGTKDRPDCEWGDPNVDGRPDFYCARGAGYGTATKANQLWIQQPDGTFRDQASAWGVTDPYGRGRQIVWLNYDGDALPDLFVSNECCRDDGLPSINQLYVNEGSRFTAQSIPGLTEEVGGRCAFGSDIDGDDYDDILVCGNEGLRIYRNTNGSGFTDEAPRLGIRLLATDAIAADLNGDSLDEIVVVSRENIWIYRGTGGWTFSRSQTIPWAQARRITATDIDGDGDLDLFVSAGEAEPNAVDALLRNRGNGLFDAEAVGVSAIEGVAGRLTSIDHDLDGRGGVLVVNSNGWLPEAGPIQLIVETTGGTPNTAQSCGRPSYDQKADPGIYLWRECDADGNGNTWKMMVTGGGSASVLDYAGRFTSSAPLAVTPQLLESRDEIRSPNPSTVEFELHALGGGQDGLLLETPSPSTAKTCFRATDLPPGALIQVGAGNYSASRFFDLDTLGPCD
jgi:hypothetical protein